MGQAHYSIHGRRKDTDKYEKIFPKLHGGYMERFKHEIYAYSLEKYHHTYKSIYLYNGYTRIAKGIKIENQLELTFYDEKTAEEWDRSEEQICSALVDIPWLQRTFSQRFVPTVTNDKTKRLFKKYT